MVFHPVFKRLVSSFIFPPLVTLPFSPLPGGVLLAVFVVIYLSVDEGVGTPFVVMLFYAIQPDSFFSSPDGRSLPPPPSPPRQV